MQLEEFLKQIGAMGSLPTEYREQLIALAPSMTDEERANTMAVIGGAHETITKAGEGMAKAFDEGIVELDAIKHAVVPAMHAKIEAEEHAAAETILPDDGISFNA